METPLPFFSPPPSLLLFYRFCFMFFFTRNSRWRESVCTTDNWALRWDWKESFFSFFLLFGGIFSMEKFHEGEKEKDNRDRSPTSVINSKEWCTIVARLSRWILSRERCRRRRRNEQSRDKVNENRMERFLIQSVICEHETPPTESEGNIRSQFWMFSFGEGGVIKLATPVLSPLSASILIRCLNSVSYWQSCSFVFLKMQMWYDRAFVRSIGPDR